MYTDESRDKRQQQQGRMHALLDYTIGFITLAGGALLVFYRLLGFDFDFPNPQMIKVFGIISMVYGVWRIYRGINKSRA
jgi:hypothetical protein